MRWLTNPVVQFLAAGFVTLLTVSIVTGALSRSAADDEAIDDARTLTQVLGRSVAQPAIPLRYNVIKSPGMQAFYAAMSQDGRTVAVGGEVGAKLENITLWDTTVPAELAADPAGQACAVTVRGLSKDEWARYIPELPHRTTC